MNPYLIVSGILLLLALALGLGNLMRGARNPDLRNDVQTVILGEREAGVLEAATVLDPMIPALSAGRTINPFTLREETATRALGILPMPPPPPLNPPSLPLLPLANEWGAEP
ncbi:MAG: hypothetical protein EA402_10225 [Planctomycetota bacterium]|nr:MAG: hypothetical protein EA402_10225 [Planctomycetota bacterium]